MVRGFKGLCCALAAVLLGASTASAQETVKVRVIVPMTGSFQSTGWQTIAALNLFFQQRGPSVAGKQVELLLRDDGGAADNAKRLA